MLKHRGSGMPACAGRSDLAAAFFRAGLRNLSYFKEIYEHGSKVKYLLQ